MTKSSDDHQSDFWIFVDEIRFAYSEIDTGGDTDNSGSKTPSSSVTINIQLTAGQIVKVQNDNSALVYGTSSGVVQSWFTGHMLYAL